MNSLRFGRPTISFFLLFLLANAITFNRNRIEDIFFHEKMPEIWMRVVQTKADGKNSSSKGLHFLCELNIKVTIMVDGIKKIIIFI